MALRIFEIYRSIQGETSLAGMPVVIIRLAGCNLTCSWCDSPESRSGGEMLSIRQVLDQAMELGRTPWKHDTGHFLVTGGEPLIQSGVHELMDGLLASGKEVLLETNGSLDISPVDSRVRRILDLKPPASGMSSKICWQNLDHLTTRDEVKLVLADRADYEWARRIIQEKDLAARATVLLSPVLEAVNPRRLAGWMIEDRLPARLQLQLHKVIWGNTAKGV